MPYGRGFFSSDKEIFRSNPDGLQGEATQYGGKKTAQTAFNGCEYRFLNTAAWYYTPFRPIIKWGTELETEPAGAAAAGDRPGIRVSRIHRGQTTACIIRQNPAFFTGKMCAI